MRIPAEPELPKRRVAFLLMKDGREKLPLFQHRRDKNLFALNINANSRGFWIRIIHLIIYCVFPSIIYFHWGARLAAQKYLTKMDHV